MTKFDINTFALYHVFYWRWRYVEPGMPGTLRQDAPVLYTWRRMLERTAEIWRRDG